MFPLRSKGVSNYAIGVFQKMVRLSMSIQVLSKVLVPQVNGTPIRGQTPPPSRMFSITIRLRMCLSQARGKRLPRND